MTQCNLRKSSSRGGKMTLLKTIYFKDQDDFTKEVDCTSLSNYKNLKENSFFLVFNKLTQEYDGLNRTYTVKVDKEYNNNTGILTLNKESNMLGTSKLYLDVYVIS